MSKMHVAIRSGFVEEDGELQEITRGVTRVAPEVLERPGYAEYFDVAVTARNSDAHRSEYRGITPDGRVFAFDPKH